MGVGHARSSKSLFKAVEVMMHGITVEMIDHPSLATRGCSLHLLLGASYLNIVLVNTINECILENRLTGSLF